MIGLEAELLIRLHRIKPLVLQLICLEFGHQPDRTPFMQLIEQNTCTRLRNHGKRHLQLLAAIAAQRAEDVAGKALRVNEDKRRLGGDIPEDKRDSLFLAAVGGGAGIKLAFKAQDAEVSPARGKIGLSLLAKCELRTHL